MLHGDTSRALGNDDRGAPRRGHLLAVIDRKLRRRPGVDHGEGLARPTHRPDMGVRRAAIFKQLETRRQVDAERQGRNSGGGQSDRSCRGGRGRARRTRRLGGCWRASGRRRRRRDDGRANRRLGLSRRGSRRDRRRGGGLNRPLGRIRRRRRSRSHGRAGRHRRRSGGRTRRDRLRLGLGLGGSGRRGRAVQHSRQILGGRALRQGRSRNDQEDGGEKHGFHAATLAFAPPDGQAAGSSIQKTAPSPGADTTPISPP